MIKKIFLTFLISAFFIPTETTATEIEDATVPITRFNIPIIMKNGLFEIITPTGNIVYIYKENNGSVSMRVIPSGLLSNHTQNMIKFKREQQAMEE